MPMYEADEQILKDAKIEKDGEGCSDWFDETFHGDIPNMALYVRAGNATGSPSVMFWIEESIDKEHVVHRVAGERSLADDDVLKIVLNDPLANWVRVRWKNSGDGTLSGVHADLMHAERQY